MSQQISKRRNNDQRSQGRTSESIEEVFSRIESAWPELTMQQWLNVNIDTRDESQWYGPWNTVLHHLFLSQYEKRGGEVAAFQVAPPPNREARSLKEDSSFYYTVSWGKIPVCIVQVKPYYQLAGSSDRLAAYRQLEDRLRNMNNPVHIPKNSSTVLYGVQCMGPLFMIMELTVPEGKLSLSYNRKRAHPDYGKLSPPRELWEHDVTTIEGAKQLVKMTMNIYDTMDNIPTGVPVDKKYSAADKIVRRARLSSSNATGSAGAGED